MEALLHDEDEPHQSLRLIELTDCMFGTDQKAEIRCRNDPVATEKRTREVGQFIGARWTALIYAGL